MEAQYRADDALREYAEKRAKKKLIKRLFGWSLAALLFVVIAILIFRFLFVVREIEIEGVVSYDSEEVLKTSGICLDDNILALSEEAVAEILLKTYPYIKSVSLRKDYPDRVTIAVEEEYTTFSYEMLGEYYLFNRNLRLMDRFPSFEELSSVRQSIVVKMPLPKSCIVPQYIKLADRCDYVGELIGALCDSPLVLRVSEFDLSDKFAIRMVIDGRIRVEFGDYTEAEDKFSALLRLIGDLEEKKSGTIDLSDYPRCFYDLKGENGS